MKRYQKVEGEQALSATGWKRRQELEGEQAGAVHGRAQASWQVLPAGM